MKKILNNSIIVLILIAGSLVTSCSNFSPEKTFDIAVLNSNLLSRFGSKEISSKLESEALVYDESQKKMIPSSYQDAFKYDISNLEIQLKSLLLDMLNLG